MSTVYSWSRNSNPQPASRVNFAPPYGWPPPYCQPGPFPISYPIPLDTGGSTDPFPPPRPDLEQSKRDMRELLVKAIEVYRPGVSREELRSLVLPGGDSQRAPKWAHDLLDSVWDFVEKRFG